MLYIICCLWLCLCTLCCVLSIVSVECPLQLLLLWVEAIWRSLKEEYFLHSIYQKPNVSGLITIFFIVVVRTLSYYYDTKTQLFPTNSSAAFCTSCVITREGIRWRSDSLFPIKEGISLFIPSCPAANWGDHCSHKPQQQDSRPFICLLQSW